MSDHSGDTICGNRGTRVLRGPKSTITQLLASQGLVKERVSQAADGGLSSGS